MQEIWAVISRHIAAAMFFIPQSKRIAIERRLRGKEEFR